MPLCLRNLVHGKTCIRNGFSDLSPIMTKNPYIKCFLSRGFFFKFVRVSLLFDNASLTIERQCLEIEFYVIGSLSSTFTRIQNMRYKRMLCSCIKCFLLLMTVVCIFVAHDLLTVTEAYTENISQKQTSKINIWCRILLLTNNYSWYLQCYLHGRIFHWVKCYILYRILFVFLLLALGSWKSIYTRLLLQIELFQLFNEKLV